MHCYLSKLTFNKSIICQNLVLLSRSQKRRCLTFSGKRIYTNHECVFFLCWRSHDFYNKLVNVLFIIGLWLIKPLNSKLWLHLCVVIIIVIIIKQRLKMIYVNVLLSYILMNENSGIYQNSYYITFNPNNQSNIIFMIQTIIPNHQPNF